MLAKGWYKDEQDSYDDSRLTVQVRRQGKVFSGCVRWTSGTTATKKSCAFLEYFQVHVYPLCRLLRGNLSKKRYQASLRRAAYESGRNFARQNQTLAASWTSEVAERGFLNNEVGGNASEG